MLRYNPETFANVYETDLGQALWSYLNEDSTIDTMKTAARIRKTPVELIEESLLARFEGHRLELDDRVKQMVGHMIKQVMAAHGYVIDQQNVKIPKGFFSRGTRYRHPDTFTFHVFRGDGRTVALTGDKANRPPTNDCHWTYYKAYDSGISARVGLGLENETEARAAIERDGYYIHQIPRITRPTM